MTPIVLHDYIANCLRVLDAEAVPLPDGTPTGLWWYARHLRRDEPMPKNCRNEEDWSRGIARLMRAESRAVETEKAYPTPPRRRCDLVFPWPEMGRVWLEVKGAWLHDDRAGKRRNPAFKKHLNAAADDLRKLETLTSAHTDFLVFLVVGFDHHHDTITPESLAIVESAAQGWQSWKTEWNDEYRVDGRVRCWWWSKPLRS